MRSRRRAGGFVAAVAGLPLLTALLHAGALPLTDDIPLFLAAVVGVALLGGLWPALLAAVGGFLLLNYFFTPPLHTLTVATAMLISACSPIIAPIPKASNRPKPSRVCLSNCHAT